MHIKKIYFTSIILLFLQACSTSDYSEDLGDGYALISESNTNQLITGPNDSGKGIVPCTVEQYNVSTGFIIVKQYDNPSCSTDIKAKKRAYWIIDKKKKLVYGPLDSTAFETKKNRLQISLTF